MGNCTQRALNRSSHVAVRKDLVSVTLGSLVSQEKGHAMHETESDRSEGRRSAYDMPGWLACLRHR
eukprot:60240-Amphidinium_carterae.1